MSELPRKFCSFGCDALVAYGVPLHRFPNPDKHPDLFATWIAVVGSKVTESDHMKIYKNKRICDHHFDPTFKTTGGRLICSATPTVNLNRIQQTITTFVATDHSYCRPGRQSTPTRTMIDITNLPGSSVETRQLPGPSGSGSSSAVEYFEKPDQAGTSLMSNEKCTKFDAGDNSSHDYNKKEDMTEEDPVVAQDLTTVNILESRETPLNSECEESLHVMQIDSLETQGIDSDQNSLFDSFGSDHLQPKPSFGSDHLQQNTSSGSDHLEQKTSSGSDHLQPKPSFGSDHLKPKPSFIVERYRFRQRKQNEIESIIQYISELYNISTFCDFNTVLEDNLRDQLIYGLRSEEIRQRLLAEEGLDYTKAVEIACALEAAEIDVGVIKQTVGSDGESGGGEIATRVLLGDSAGNVQRGFANDSRNNCLLCGATDHQVEDCRQSRFVYGKKTQKGHLKRVRPMRPGGRQQDRYDTDDKEAHFPAATGVTGQVDQLGEDKPPSSDREDWETEEDELQLSRKGYKRVVIWVDEAQLSMDIDMESFVSCLRKT